MGEKNIFTRSVKIGKFNGLEYHVRPSVIPIALLIWVVFSLLGLKKFKWKPATAFIGGFLAVLIHYASETWHQIGHSKMAEQTGYPMKGIQFWGPLSSSIYPKYEGVLSADVHIQRALGGPFFSLVLTLISGAVALAIRPFGGIAMVLVFFTFLDNFLVLTIGALIPLGFNDGSTLYHWWGKRSRQQSFLSLR